MDIPLAKVLFELGLVGEKTVVETAVDALQGDTDSPALRLLAGLGPGELAQTGDLLSKTADDLQLPVPDELSAILTAGRWVARQGLTGRWTIQEALALDRPPDVVRVPTVG
jgi:hypothetical protein